MSETCPACGHPEHDLICDAECDCAIGGTRVPAPAGGSERMPEDAFAEAERTLSTMPGKSGKKILAVLAEARRARESEAALREALYFPIGFIESFEQNNDYRFKKSFPLFRAWLAEARAALAGRGEGK